MMKLIAILFLALILQACGGGDSDTVALSAKSATIVRSVSAGPTPFTGFVDLDEIDINVVRKVAYSILPRTGSTSKPVSVSFDAAYLKREGYAGGNSRTVRLPVFGLYADYLNTVQVQLTFNDGSTRSLNTTMQAAAHTGPTAFYAKPTVVTAPRVSDALGFSYFYIRSGYGTPVVLDTDGQVRWVGVRPAVGTPNPGTGGSGSTSAVWTNNGFVVGAGGSTISRYELDGRTSTTTLTEPRYTLFHHNIDTGLNGLLGEFDQIINGVNQIESLVAEFDARSGKVLKEWDFGKIISEHMRANGDNPDLFVIPGKDWFHVNASTYDPQDRSIIASSRENFVVKVSYDTGKLIWMLGDPTKYWYSFASLRAKAITLQGDGLYPIGQHAVSITSDGLLQLFNNGFESANQPVGAAVGERRNFSPVSTYAIDTATLTAREVRRFTHPSRLFSDICSSAYSQADGSMLVAYAATDNRKKARLVGVLPAGGVAFDYEYPSPLTCQTAFNADVVRLESLEFR